jgi:hypothetical protein
MDKLAALQCEDHPDELKLQHRWENCAKWFSRLQHPRRITAIDVSQLYRSALGQLANEHAAAKELEPGSPEAARPQAVPTHCDLTVRQLLDVGGNGPDGRAMHIGECVADAVCWKRKSTFPKPGFAPREEAKAAVFG